MNHYLVCSVKPWHWKQFEIYSRKIPGKWTLIKKPGDLTAARLKRLRPKYVFFPHWSWHVPNEIAQNYECICFHSSDVPYGRGGSPIQNLIARGHVSTKVSALRMVEEMDAGPVYLKQSLSLKGSAQKIYERSAVVIGKMIGEITVRNPAPRVQHGKAVVFKRRTQAQNTLPLKGSLREVYNHIRMLDAETYPHSFIQLGNFVVELTKAKIEKNSVVAQAVIRQGRR